MGHESRIEPWLPLTTVLLVSFRADWLRREQAMKTARRENRNCWAAVFSIPVDGLAGQNSPLYVGLEARETPAVKGEEFSLDAL
jgi:hypothetical protein